MSCDNKKIQLIWWGFDCGTLKRWGCWYYPVKGSSAYELLAKPIFYGLCLGVIELRYFPKLTFKQNGHFGHNY